MTFKFECPHCGQHFSATPEYVATAATCSTCGGAFVVPSPPSSSATRSTGRAKSRQRNPSLTLLIIVSALLMIAVGGGVYFARSGGASTSASSYTPPQPLSQAEQPTPQRTPSLADTEALSLKAAQDRDARVQAAIDAFAIPPFKSSWDWSPEAIAEAVARVRSSPTVYNVYSALSTARGKVNALLLASMMSHDIEVRSHRHSERGGRVSVTVELGLRSSDGAEAFKSGRLRSTIYPTIKDIYIDSLREAGFTDVTVSVMTDPTK